MSHSDFTYKSVRPSSIVIPDSNKDIISNDILSWNNDQILLWLKNKQYSDDLIQLFKSHNITGMVLPYLNTQELKEMGISNLKTRLTLMNEISSLLLEKNLNIMKFNNDPIAMDLQSLVLSTNLISSISNAITESLLASPSTTNYSQKRITDQFNKLKEDLLPILKEIKDKKPLPTPDFNQSYQSPSISTQTSPVRLSHHQSQLQATIRPQSIQPSISSKKLSSSSTYRKSINTPPAISPVHPETAPSSSVQSSSTLNPTSAGVSGQRSPMKPMLSHSNSSMSVRQSLKASKQNSSSSIPQQSSSSPSNEPLKQLRAKTEDPCYKILQAAMKRHNLEASEWKKYALVICYGGDQERVLGYDERPVLVFRELHELGLSPSIMLRQVEENDDLGSMNHDIPGGRL
ncbi:hypothetical protein CANARDRAFT_29782 [[Candida] arabinofermentans NRRL YB-2248]|uniref:SAM domain-containing protein n=1 Tax=[Candida] arabinofermentans NRRL YB-2248 TaxID=983967 RepID=A0A1E4SVM1_9ASCO|nr:hypothetical protein CANARDRAFT_29782 [[Candida] arabinofermentans NRRL YB-2248]